MQREGCTENTFCQQLINPKQAFLLVAIWSLGQDLKELWGRLGVGPSLDM